MYFIDGTTPPWAIVEQFLKVMESQKGVAVHCKQGLGRTGYAYLFYLCLNG
jgi:protein-tyrosine phosphatase